MTANPVPTGADAQYGSGGSTARQSQLSGLLNDLTMPMILAAFATYLTVNMLTMDVPATAAFPGPRFFPAIIAVLIYVLVALDVVASFRKRALAAKDAPVDGEPSTQRFSFRSFAWIVGGFFVFSLLLNFLGWILAAGLLFWCVAQGFGASKGWKTIITGLTVSSIAYIAFDMGLGLSLPSGILGGGF